MKDKLLLFDGGSMIHEINNERSLRFKKEGNKLLSVKIRKKESNLSIACSQ